MRAFRGPWLAAWCAVMTALVWPGAAPQAQSERTTEQVIVSFTAESEPGQSLARINLGAIDDPTGDARLVEIAQDLSERLGVPLRLEGLTSGRELLLAVDREALGAAFAERLEQREDVTRVEVLEPKIEPGGASAGPRLGVEFVPGSEFAAAAATGRRLALGEPSGEGVGGVGVEPTVESSSPASAVLALDLDAVATRLLERLQAEPDVLYAQPNLLLRRYGSKGS